MIVYIVRHGETNYNTLGLHNADPAMNVHLTEKGIEEAKRLAQELQDKSFDVVYTSELPRTQQTADYLDRNHNIPRIVDARLNDIDAGFEGRPVSEYHKLRDVAEDPFTFKVPGAESSEDVYGRTNDFIRDLKNQDYRSVLIITSKHNFRHFRNIIDGLDPRESLKRHVPNVEVLIREI